MLPSVPERPPVPPHRHLDVYVADRDRLCDVERNLVSGHGSRLRWRKVARQVRGGSSAGMLEPFPQTLVYVWVVQEREVVRGAHVVTVLGLEWDASGAALSSRARDENEDV